MVTAISSITGIFTSGSSLSAALVLAAGASGHDGDLELGVFPGSTMSRNMSDVSPVKHSDGVECTWGVWGSSLATTGCWSFAAERSLRLNQGAED